MLLNVTKVKIPTKMQGLVDLTLLPESMLKEGLQNLITIMQLPNKVNTRPSSSNITWGKIAEEIEKYWSNKSSWRNCIVFDFYCAKNPFVGHKVISHADFAKNGLPRINYNTRFSGASTYTVKDYWKNLFHEFIHHIDAQSPYSFGHKNATDYKSAPYQVGEWAGMIFDGLINTDYEDYSGNRNEQSL